METVFFKTQLPQKIKWWYKIITKLVFDSHIKYNIKFDANLTNTIKFKSSLIED